MIDHQIHYYAVLEYSPYHIQNRDVNNILWLHDLSHKNISISLTTRFFFFHESKFNRPSYLHFDMNPRTLETRLMMIKKLCSVIKKKQMTMLVFIDYSLSIVQLFVDLSCDLKMA